MNEYEQIDDYLENRLTDGERSAFEQSLLADPGLADTVAFYVLTRQVARQEAHDARKAEWAGIYQPTTSLWRSGSWAYAAAAVIVLLAGIGWYFFRPQPTLNQQADRYITDTFQQLTVTMDAGADSLKLGSDLFNKAKLTQAGVLFNDLYQRDPANAKALEYAGIVSLRQQNYDQAVDQFHRLSQRTDLFVNPGMFYEALARIKRNNKGDEAKARQLLQTVIDQKLEGAKVAKEWINSY